MARARGGVRDRVGVHGRLGVRREGRASPVRVARHEHDWQRVNGAICEDCHADHLEFAMRCEDCDVTRCWRCIRNR